VRRSASVHCCVDTGVVVVAAVVVAAGVDAKK
jgi:hypothetical protein